MSEWIDYMATRRDLCDLEDEACLQLRDIDPDYDIVQANIAKLQAANREWEAAR
jgi:hypothetical protein